VTGQTVTTFSDNAEAGKVMFEWDASDMASGIYFYKLDANNFTDTKKMVLLK
ncbi:MAG: T9SS type A sorting domain-containing protein, partial [candidate division Zixibacteria bacterium]|nr:T9SS type A sorting domain-containing protein [candidate division Zixibacteria bacterium]